MLRTPPCAASAGRHKNKETKKLASWTINHAPFRLTTTTVEHKAFLNVVSLSTFTLWALTNSHAVWTSNHSDFDYDFSPSKFTRRKVHQLEWWNQIDSKFTARETRVRLPTMGIVFLFIPLFYFTHDSHHQSKLAFPQCIFDATYAIRDTESFDLTAINELH